MVPNGLQASLQLQELGASPTGGWFAPRHGGTPSSADGLGATLQQMASCFGGLFTRPIVPAAYCRPSRGSEHIDCEALHKLLQAGKLVPFFPGSTSTNAAPSHREAAIIAKLLTARSIRKGKHRPKKTTAEVLAHLAAVGLESCPGCAMHFPALNTAKCCGKRVCTQCYLQVRRVENPAPGAASVEQLAVHRSCAAGGGPRARCRRRRRALAVLSARGASPNATRPR